MGNNTTKEARGSDFPSNHGNHDFFGASSQAGPVDRNQPQVNSNRHGRGTRSDHSLGIGSSSSTSRVERRETKQEREIRKLEKERQARIKERERSLREEDVDGGYLVTMGIYTGLEDFNKAVVRELMIKRRIAPFWRGLNEISESWTDYQLIAAARGLPIPSADNIPPKEVSPNLRSPKSSEHNLNDLLSPGSPDSGFVTPDSSAQPSASKCTISNTDLGSTLSPFLSSHQTSFRARSKTVSSLALSSPNFNSLDVAQEVKLAKDPFVNGQYIELFLYKNSIECPICFLSYPQYLNKTRCCDQPVCSECFVQIKRLDPHPPEHHVPSDQMSQDPVPEVNLLVSEPACCPYCQQPDFGVTYEPPNFRRGIVYAGTLNSNVGTSHAIPSLCSDESNLTNKILESKNRNRRRTSISATAPTVITTDRIRPDWAVKLANARTQLARRSAAATALHAAAYLIGNGNSDTRGFSLRSSRHGRAQGAIDCGNFSELSTHTQNLRYSANSPLDQHPPNPNDLHRNEIANRRSRIQDIEELMMIEAIRLSLATEEERKKKAGKEAIKEAKKQVKEGKKREKKEKKEKRGIYGGSTNTACGSSLSLNLPGLGRRRRNSVVVTLPRETTQDDSGVANLKGKNIDRRPNSHSDSSIPIDISDTKTVNWNSSGTQPLDHSHLASVDENLGVSPSNSEKGSQTPQISNPSSSASSFSGSAMNSPRHNLSIHSPLSFADSQCSTRISALSHSSEITLGSESNDGKESESLLNFQSLAAMVLDDEDMSLDKGSSSYHIEDIHQTSDRLELFSKENYPAGMLAEDLNISQKNKIITTQHPSLRSQISSPGAAVPPQSSGLVDENKKSEFQGKIQDHNNGKKTPE